MSFFSRKPNPPVPSAVAKQLKQAALQGMNQAGPDSAEGQAISNARFRSFCERYIVERCRDWKENEVDARSWEAILQARSIYNKVKEVGRTLTNDN